MLNPALLNEEQKTAIMTQFSQLVERGILDINQDIDDPIRQEFERVVLDAFGIGEYFDNIVSSLKTMRKVRKAVRQTIVQLRPLRGSERSDNDLEQLMLMAAESQQEN